MRVSHPGRCPGLSHCAPLGLSENFKQFLSFRISNPFFPLRPSASSALKISLFDAQPRSSDSFRPHNPDTAPLVCSGDVADEELIAAHGG
jgi:hypothetical protein